MKILVVGLFAAISLAHAGEGKGALPTCKQIQKSFSVKSPKVKTKSSMSKTANKASTKKVTAQKTPEQKTSVQKAPVKNVTSKAPEIAPSLPNPTPPKTVQSLPTKTEELLPTPVLTQEQLTELFFDPNRKVTFELTWNMNTKLDRSIAVKQGKDQSVLFQDLATKKLFALMFADLYLMNRDELELQAEKYLKPGQKWVVQIYFQRFASDLNQFGSSAFNISEQECVDWLKGGAPKNAESANGLMKYSMVCAPGIHVLLGLQENGQIIWSKEIVPLEALPYGPGTGRPVMTVEDILKGMRSH